MSKTGNYFLLFYCFTCYFVTLYSSTCYFFYPSLAIKMGNYLVTSNDPTMGEALTPEKEAEIIAKSNRCHHILEDWHHAQLRRQARQAARAGQQDQDDDNSGGAASGDAPNSPHPRGDRPEDLGEETDESSEQGGGRDRDSGEDSSLFVNQTTPDPRGLLPLNRDRVRKRRSRHKAPLPSTSPKTRSPKTRSNSTNLTSMKTRLDRP